MCPGGTSTRCVPPKLPAFGTAMTSPPLPRTRLHTVCPRIRRRFCYDDIAAPDVVSHHRQLLHQHEVSRSVERRQHTRPQAHGDVHTVVVDHVHQATHLESHRTVGTDLTPDVREHSGRARHLPLLDARCPWLRQRSRVANGVPDGIPSSKGVEHRVGVHCLDEGK